MAEMNEIKVPVCLVNPDGTDFEPLDVPLRFSSMMLHQIRAIVREELHPRKRKCFCHDCEELLPESKGEWVAEHMSNYDVFVCGHTHRTLSTTFGKTMVINPGTANGWFLGYKATAAIFDTTDRHIEFINL